MPPRDLVTGALLIMGSELLFATMGAAVKWAAAGLPIAMIVLGRSVFALVPFVPLLWRGAGPSLRPTPGVWPLYLLRGALGLSAMACFFYALAHLALADGMLLKMTAPIFMPVIGALWLAERPSRAAMVAVPVGLVGVAFVLEPQGELAPAAVVGLAGGVLAGGAKVSVRRLTRTEPASRVVVGFAVLASLLSAPFAVMTWQWPSAFEWGLLVTIGPAQAFIQQARKTQDLYWGSALLSHLAWAAMTPVVAQHGPDAVFFPDLYGQPLVDAWLQNECGVDLRGAGRADDRWCWPMVTSLNLPPSTERSLDRHERDT
ncbi:MAG: hypothetical protein BRD57_05385, partial [Proteobacteria bacterium SW_6_67_9]